MHVFIPYGMSPMPFDRFELVFYEIGLYLYTRDIKIFLIAWLGILNYFTRVLA